jgi:hypothetical protein
MPQGKPRFPHQYDLRAFSLEYTLGGLTSPRVFPFHLGYETLGLFAISSNSWSMTNVRSIGINS